jgi:hypothetical protein
MIHCRMRLDERRGKRRRALVRRTVSVSSGCVVRGACARGFGRHDFGARGLEPGGLVQVKPRHPAIQSALGGCSGWREPATPHGLLLTAGRQARRRRASLSGGAPRRARAGTARALSASFRTSHPARCERGETRGDDEGRADARSARAPPPPRRLATRTPRTRHFPPEPGARSARRGEGPRPCRLPKWVK